ncbi:MAG TPA: hypothetical protein VEG68_00065 [Terriglobales bacterium]|nr:hypothetical protein [Terriglobales bacterium]
MPKRKKSATTEPALEGYVEFLRDLNLVGLGLRECSAKLDRSRYFNAVAESRSAVRNIEAQYTLSTQGKNFVDVQASFDLKVRNRNGQDCLALRCVFEAHFHCPTFRKEFAERFATSEARLALWPYFRQFVSDTTARMAIPPITVPLATRTRTGSRG